MANTNGNVAGAQGAGMYNAGMNGIPTAGHFSDMQTLMQNMESLSGWLQQNREDFLRVQDGLERVERMQGRQVTATVNGDAPASSTEPEVPTLTSLHRALDAANGHITTLERQNSEHLRLQALYEETLTEAVDKTRNYVFQQNEYIISLHQHYTKLLRDSRKETISAQLIHQEWQASLSRLNEELKKAVSAREQEKDPFRRRLAALREENRLLREKVGWEAKEWDSEADEEAEDAGREDGPGADFRGRPFRGNASLDVRREEREKVLENVMGPDSGK